MAKSKIDSKPRKMAKITVFCRAFLCGFCSERMGCTQGRCPLCDGEAPTPETDLTPDGGRRTVIDVPEGSVRVNPDEPTASEQGGAAMGIESPQTGMQARFQSNIESILDHLKQFNEIAHAKAKPKLREWKRVIYGSSDPTFPPEYLTSGREIAVELLDHIRCARQQVADEFCGELPLWALPLSTVDQQIQSWIGFIDGPCADMARLVIEGQEFLLDCADWLANLRARLTNDVNDRPSNPEPPKRAPALSGGPQNKGKGGRPRLTQKDEELAIAYETERFVRSNPGCTWAEACEAIRRLHGLKVLRVSTVKSRLYRAKGQPPAKLRIA